MKNFKNIFYILIIILGIVIILVYRTLQNKDYEDISYNTFLENNLSDESIKEEKLLVLHITGEVVNPGIIKIKEGSRLIDAIEEAGGVTEKANLDKVNLAFQLSDGQKIYIPSIYEEDIKKLITSDSGEDVIEDFSINNGKKININNASQSELVTLTGIGPSTAERIIHYRKEKGNFKNIEELKNVPGIGESKFKIIKDQICV